MPRYCKNDVIVVPLPATSPLAMRNLQIVTMAQAQPKKQNKSEKAAARLRKKPAAAAGHVDEGKKCLDEGNFAAALDAFELAAGADSRRLATTADSRRFLGNIFFKIGEGLAKEVRGSEFVSVPLAILSKSDHKQATLDRIATAYSNAIQFGCGKTSALENQDLWRLLVAHVHRAAVFITRGDFESALEDMVDATSTFKRVKGNGAEVQGASKGYHFNLSVLYKAMSANVGTKKEQYMCIADQHWACYETSIGLGSDQHPVCC